MQEFVRMQSVCVPESPTLCISQSCALKCPLKSTFWILTYHPFPLPRPLSPLTPSYSSCMSHHISQAASGKGQRPYELMWVAYRSMANTRTGTQTHTHTQRWMTWRLCTHTALNLSPTFICSVLLTEPQPLHPHAKYLFINQRTLIYADTLACLCCLYRDRATVHGYPTSCYNRSERERSLSPFLSAGLTWEQAGQWRHLLVALWLCAAMGAFQRIYEMNNQRYWVHSSSADSKFTEENWH